MLQHPAAQQAAHSLIILCCAAFHLQIDYSTVFFFEYFGPLVIYPLFFLLPQIFYPGQKWVYMTRGSSTTTQEA
jgi:hypothetical protein